MTGKFLINNLKSEDKKKGVTLVVTFSRKVFVPIFFEALRKMGLPREIFHLLVYDNSEDRTLEKDLREEIKKLKDQYLSIRLYKSYIKARGSVLGTGNEIFKESKLWNIWQMWNKVYKMVYTELFFQLEDDTVAPPNSFVDLLKIIEKDKKVGMATGIATGRFAYPWLPVRLGVHNMEMKGQKVLKRHSLPPNTRGIKEVDASGVYCFIARTKAFLTGFEGYDPVKLNVPFFALDNVLTWNIKQHGYKIMANFNVWCSHLQASSARIISFSKDQAIEMMDLWIPECNNYAHGVEVRKKGQKVKRNKVKKHADSWEI